MAKRNGYVRVPTTDPYPVTHTRMKDAERRRKLPKSLRPGLYYAFGERGKFLEGGDSGSEEIELSEMTGDKKWRKPKSPKSPKSPKTPKLKKTKPKIRHIHEPIQDGDTVQRVALRYGVPNAEILRANHLYCDQDFFALKTVKIPVKEHSLLTEAVELEKRRKAMTSETEGGITGSGNQSSSNSDEMRLGGPSTYYNTEEEDSGDADDEKGDSDAPEYRNVSIQSALKWKYSRDSLLKKFDEELERVRESTEQKVQNHRQVAIHMYPSFHPVAHRQPYDKLLSGIDRRWWYVGGGLAMCFVLLLLIILRILWCYYSSNSENCSINPIGR